MQTKTRRLISLFFLLSLGILPVNAQAGLPVIPAPWSVQTESGRFTLESGERISWPKGDAKARVTAEYLVQLLKDTASLSLEASEDDATAAVQLKRVSDLSDREAYRLHVTPRKITISASGDAGLFYGAGTLWQLASESPAVKAMSIEDRPRFGWRGLLLDSARHFQSVAFIKTLLDTMALHKLNLLHWHLTDDQAWRLEIKRYPRLTSFGAWRVPPGDAAQKDIDPTTGKPRLYGGFYSQDEVRDLVRYAAFRGVTIMPEIEMPGHSTAAVVAYPELASTSSPPGEVPSSWGIFPYLYQPTDKSFEFLENVMDEVMTLFPSPYIHVGGDEAVKDEWKSSPEIQALMKSLGLQDEDKLEGWFIKKIEAYLESHGRKLIGWYEVQNGDLGPNAGLMTWHGTEDATQTLKQERDTVQTVYPELYFDQRMVEGEGEPPGDGGIDTLETVYRFEPMPKRLRPEQAKHLLGVDGAVWTESLRTEEQVELMTFPRALAVAEMGWSAPENKSWRRFLKRLPSAYRRFESLGRKISDSPFKPLIDENVDLEKETVKLTARNQSGFGKLRYTTDGSEPGPQSPVLGSSLELHLGAQLKVATFSGAQKLSRVIERDYNPVSVRTLTSFSLQSCTSNSLLAIEDDAPLAGPRAIFFMDRLNPCWIYPKADLAHGATLSAVVGKVPYNFTLADTSTIHFHLPATPDGELEVRMDTCEGARIAVLPLQPVASELALGELPSAMLPKFPGKHDLCLTFTQNTVDYLWLMDHVSVMPGSQ